MSEEIPNKKRIGAIPVKKRIFSELKEKPSTKQEIVHDIESLGVPGDSARKRVERYLEEFQQLGLVVEKEGKFFWYSYSGLYETIKDSENKVTHSKQLIPALKALALLPLTGTL